MITRAGADAVSFGRSRFVSRNGARWSDRGHVLVPVRRDLALVQHQAGVVDEHVDPVQGLVQAAGQRADLVQAGQIGDLHLRRRGPVGLDGGRGRFGAARVAADHDDLRPLPGQRGGGRLADT